MPWSEARLMQLIANAEQDGNTQDVPHWRRILESVRNTNRSTQ